MDKNYLLKIIKKNFIILSKDEISEKIGEISYFDPKRFLTKLIRQQNNKLDDEQYQGLLHSYFFDVINPLVKDLKEDSCKFDPRKGACGIFNPRNASLADAAQLVISVYYHYPNICLPSLMYSFIRLVLKEKILLV